MATLKDISNLTGISVSTISRVLNNDETISVANETREKIFAAANELGYTPSKNKNKADVPQKLKIGIAQMFEMEQILEDSYYMYMKAALEKACFARGIETTNLFRNEQGKFITQAEFNLDGIFAIGSFTKEEIDSFKVYTNNIVFVDSAPDDEVYFSVLPNFHLGIRLAVNKFLQNGHTDIGFIGSHYTLQETRDLILDTRLYYFRNMLTDRGVYNEEFVLNCEMNSRSAYEVMNDFLKSSAKRPTALFVSSDAMANGVLKALHENHVKVPENMSVIAFNDTPLSENTRPPLSSIRVLQYELAQAALTSMDLKRSGIKYPFKTVVPCLYIERESVANIKADRI